jgi:transcriptional regulator with PAS, ATPase and Fis domain
MGLSDSGELGLAVHPTSAPGDRPTSEGLGASDPDALLSGLPSELNGLRQQIRRVAPQETTLLLVGETGTGKTRLARLIHELSPRRDESFLVIDCGALSASLIESEMFGHVRGAFTGADRDRVGKFAAAGRGTVLLDEVNSLPLALQSRLLRAVDERVIVPVGCDRPQPIHARMIAACNVALEDEVTAGRFRADLYYRLNVVAFHLPGLRDRRSAIVPLAHKFLVEFATRNRPDIQGMTLPAVQALHAYDWPGNIRELRNVVERAVALAPGPAIDLADLPPAVQGALAQGGPTESATRFPAQGRPSGAAPVPPTSPTLVQTMEEAEVLRIKEALRRNHNNRLRAAKELGISRMGLYKKLRKYGLFDSE